MFAACNLLPREKKTKCESRPHASLVHFSLGKKMAAVPVVSTAHLHFNDVFLSTYGHLLSHASLTTLLINSTMEGTPSGQIPYASKQKGSRNSSLTCENSVSHERFGQEMISSNIALQYWIYYSEKHCRRALTNSKNVNAVFINKFAVKGSTNYSVLVHILWKCLFKLMQYSMVYSVSCRSISRRLLFMHFTGMPV